MRVLFTAAEIYPFVKTGGLGDVVGALPPALISQNIDVRLLVPAYLEILGKIKNIEVYKQLPNPYFGQKNARILKTVLPDGIIIYLLDIPGFYNRSNPYVDKGGRDWPDNHLRFGALCHAAANIATWEDDWTPDIIHGHDWHCGLIPAYLHKMSVAKPATVMTIHNIAYQGIFPRKVMPEIELSPDLFAINGLEFYGQVSFLKAGLSYSDAITAVSPHYAQEIQQPEYGCGLEDVLKLRTDNVSGILNGIDLEVWNPETDPILAQFYHGRTSKALRQKTKNRMALLDDCKLRIRSTRPVFGVVSRFTEQKGLDVLLNAIPEILQQGAGLIVLGTGDPELEEGFTGLSKRWPTQVSVHIGYDENHAHQIVAGSDILIIPSRFEPCGLVQLYGLRYGTLPLVRNTGGLADTVIDAKNDGATGFSFNNLTVPELSYTMQRAFNMFSKKREWALMQKRAMAQNFGWSTSAANYKALYKNLIKTHA